MSDEKKFNVGDIVRWTSQSAGTWTKKNGRVVAVIPKLTEILDVPEAMWFIESSDFSSPEFGFPRRGESYLVMVDKRGPRGGPAKSALYWPRASKLEEGER